MRLLSQKIIGIIPARGGSKGIPKKNIRMVGGKPLIGWTIEIASNIQEIDRLIVSTDNEEIASISKKFGAEVPFLRPDEISTDESKDYDVFHHLILWLEKKERYYPDIVIWLRPTSPLRSMLDILSVIRLIQDNPSCCVRSITKAGHHPYWMKKKSGDILLPLCPNKSEKEYPRRQLLPDVYYLNGAVDAFWVNEAEKNGALFQEKMIGYEMPIERSIDIDTELDLKIAHLLLKEKRL